MVLECLSWWEPEVTARWQKRREKRRNEGCWGLLLRPRLLFSQSIYVLAKTPEMTPYHWQYRIYIFWLYSPSPNTHLSSLPPSPHSVPTGRQNTRWSILAKSTVLLRRPDHPNGGLIMKAIHLIYADNLTKQPGPPLNEVLFMRDHQTYLCLNFQQSITIMSKQQ